MKTTVRRLSKMQGDINNALNRAKNSASEDFLQDEKTRLTDALALVKSATQFENMVVAPAQDPELFFELKQVLVAAGFVVGQPYDEYEIVLRGRQYTMCGDAQALVVLCTTSNPHMQRMESKYGLQRSELTAVAEGVVLDAVLEMAGKLAASDIPRTVEQCIHKKSIIQVHAAIATFKGNPSLLIEDALQEEIRRFSTFVDPFEVPVNTLATDIEYTQEARSRQHDGLGPLTTFLTEGSIGLKMLAAGQETYEVRKGEAESEDVIKLVQDAAQKAVDNGIFTDEADQCVYADALVSKPLKEFAAACTKANDVLASVKGLRAAKKKQLVADLLASQKMVLEKINSSFDQMYCWVSADAARLALEALKNAGKVVLNRHEDSSAHRSGVLDLSRIKTELFAEDVLKQFPEYIKLAGAPKALAAGVEKAMQARVKTGRALFDTLVAVVLHQCPQVAALHDAAATDVGLTECEAFLASEELATVLSDEERRQEFIAAMKGPLAEMLHERRCRIFCQASSLVDSCMEGSSGLKPEQVEELCGRMPAGVVASTLSKFLHACCAEAPHAQVSVGKEALKALAESDAGVLKMLTQTRVTAMINFLEKLVADAAAVVEGTRAAAVKELEELTESTMATLEKIDILSEKQFMETMRLQSKQLASTQSKIEKLVASVSDFVDPHVAWDANICAGTIMYLVSHWAAVIMYRSAFCGKASAVGEKTAHNLDQVLLRINRNAFAVKAEHTLAAPLLKEIRTFAKRPVPADTLVAPEPAEQEPPAPAETTAAAAPADTEVAKTDVPDGEEDMSLEAC